MWAWMYYNIIYVVTLYDHNVYFLFLSFLILFCFFLLCPLSTSLFLLFCLRNVLLIFTLILTTNWLNFSLLSLLFGSIFFHIFFNYLYCSILLFFCFLVFCNSYLISIWFLFVFLLLNMSFSINRSNKNRRN